MPNKFKRLLKLTSSGLLAVMLTWSCENDPASIGLETLPSSDRLTGNINETNIFGSNFIPENILSDNSSLDRSPYGIIGYFNDPLFGLTKADIVTEITLSANITSFKYNSETSQIEENSFIPDSAVLNLAYIYENWYGNPDASHTIEVYELTERLDSALSIYRYYSDFDINGKYDSNIIGQKTISAADTLSSTDWENSNYLNTISIKLDDELTQRLFNLDETELSSSDAFKDAFNGLYITVSNPEDPEAIGSLIKLDLHNFASNLTLYYHNIDDSEEVLSYIFPINESSRFFNRFDHNNADKVEVNTTETDRLMIQGMAGSQAKIDISQMFEQWSDSLENSENNFIISGADLVFYADTTNNSTDLYTPLSSQLSITHLDENNIPITATDKDIDGNTITAFKYSITYYNETDNSYTFKLNQEYFEKAARGELDPSPLFISLPNSQFTFNRVVLYNNDSEYAPLFKVRYVKFEE